jgi:hypothetical protein
MPALGKAARRQRRAIVEHVHGKPGIGGILGVELHQHVDVAEAEIVGAAADAGHRLAGAAGWVERDLEAFERVVAALFREKKRRVGAVIGRIERNLEVGFGRRRRRRRDTNAEAGDGRRHRPSPGPRRRNRRARAWAVGA